MDGIVSLIALAGTAFAAATLLPLSSELAVLAALKGGVGSPLLVIIAATIGNVAGCCFNWWLGRHVRRFEGRRWFPFSPATIALASERYRRWGIWSLLLSWLPIVGDPLTFAAGLMRVPMLVFVPLVTLARGGRYVTLAAIAA